MSVTGAVTQEDGAEVRQHTATSWQLFDELYLAIYHHLPTDAHQQALGLVNESKLSDSAEKEGRPPSSDGHAACIVLVFRSKGGP